MYSVLLAIHIGSGTLGLVVGPLAMLARAVPAVRRRHGGLGRAYLGCVAALCASALGLVALDPGLWWLGVIAVGTLAASASGWAVRPSGPRRNISLHVSMMCGSYISFVTAFLVVNLDGLVWWIAPTIVGSPLIALTSRHAARARAAVVPSSLDT